MLDIEAVGNAELTVEVGHLDDISYILSVTGRAASAVFADNARKGVDVEIDSNGPGWPFGVATAYGLYVQGRDPVVTLDVAPVSAALREFGFHTVRLTVCPPNVDAVISGSPPGVESGQCRRWRFTDASAAPTIRVEMHAEAWRGWIQVVLSLASALAAAIAWFVYFKRRDRACAARLIIGVGAFAVLLFLGGLLFVGAGTDELGVRGPSVGI